MAIIDLFFGKDDGMKSPAYFKSQGNCEYDCLGCPHLDVDCKGDEMEDEDLFHELYDDDEEW